MALPSIHGEFGIVTEPEIRFNDKGNAWLKLRCVAKDRVFHEGTWVDGDPLFIDVIVGNGAQNLYESATKGDTILVNGKLRLREYQKDDEKRVTYQIIADSCGVSTRWGTARSQKSIESTKPSAQVAKEVLGATEVDDSPPF